MLPPSRYRDGSDSGLYDLAMEDILIVCPRCAERALVRPMADDLFGPRRLVCPSCSLTRDSGTSSIWGRPIDPWFRCELFLTAPFRGKTLWALNQHHAQHLRDYIEAGLRERKPSPRTGCRCYDLRMSMVEKLPTWMKVAQNREPLVRLLDGFLERAA